MLSHGASSIAADNGLRLVTFTNTISTGIYTLSPRTARAITVAPWSRMPIHVAYQRVVFCCFSGLGETSWMRSPELGFT